MNLPDTALLEKWINHNDAEAFTQIIKRHSSMVYSTCLRILRNYNRSWNGCFQDKTFPHPLAPRAIHTNPIDTHQPMRLSSVDSFANARSYLARLAKESYPLPRSRFLSRFKFLSVNVCNTSSEVLVLNIESQAPSK